jgi:UDP-glucose 4-epimerase
MNEYLITGGLGFIGSHLALELLKHNNNRVWIVDDGSNSAWNPRKGRLDYDVHVRDLLAQLMGGYEVDCDSRSPRMVCISGDCAHRNVLDRIRAGHFRAVFHLAADVSVIKSIEEPLLFLERNVVKTLKIAKACADGSTRLIFSSSAAIYESDSEKSIALKESDTKSPANPYGLSKLTCENWLETYKDLYNLDFVNLRYFNVYGERQRGGSPYAGVLGNWVHALHFKKPLVIYGDGKQSRDFIHVSDVVRANIKSIDVPTSEFRSYNVCTGISISLNEIVRMLQAKTNETFKVLYKEARQSEIIKIEGSNARALVGLNWEPTIFLDEGIEQVLQWRGIR